MSWSINQRGLGTQLSAATEGLFHRESERSHHNEYSRIILASHLDAVRLYATSHPHEKIEAQSFGHFSPTGFGEATLRLFLAPAEEPDLLTDQPNDTSTEGATT